MTQYEIVYVDGKMYKCNDHYPDTYALNSEIIDEFIDEIKK